MAKSPSSSTSDRPAAGQPVQRSSRKPVEGPDPRVAAEQEYDQPPADELDGGQAAERSPRDAAEGGVEQVPRREGRDR